MVINETTGPTSEALQISLGPSHFVLFRTIARAAPRFALFSVQGYALCTAATVDDHPTSRRSIVVFVVLWRMK